MYPSTYIPQRPNIPIPSSRPKQQYKPKPRFILYDPFNHNKPRSYKAQSLLEAILALLKARALEVGLGREADELINKLMNRRK